MKVFTPSAIRLRIELLHRRIADQQRLLFSSSSFVVVANPSIHSSLYGTSVSRSSSTVSSPPPHTQKRLDVAIIGLPNAGKSQLLNVLLQTNIAAVSRKRHTTRKGILGARTICDTQLMFVDTPGYMTLQDAKSEAAELQKLIESSQSNVAESDLSILVIDAAKTLTETVHETIASLMLHACISYVKHKQQAMQFLCRSSSDEDECKRFISDIASVPLVIVLNKVDLVKPKTKLIQLAYEMSVMADECWERAEMLVQEEEAEEEENNGKDLGDNNIGSLNLNSTKNMTKNGNTSSSPATLASPSQQEREECPVFMISALHNDGVDDILNMLLTEAMPGEWMLEAGEITEMSAQERVQEIIREKIYRSVHREVPHQVVQWNRRFEYLNVPQKVQKLNLNDDGDNGKTTATSKVLRIEQDLLVQTKSHQRLLQGKNFATLQRIGNQARLDLEQLFQCPVSLELRAKVRKAKNLRGQLEDLDNSYEDEPL